MNDQQIDAAVRECASGWKRSSFSLPHESHGLEVRISALVRRIRDAERERCAEYVDCLALRFEDGATYTRADIVHAANNVSAAIRAPRTEEKR